MRCHIFLAYIDIQTKGAKWNLVKDKITDNNLGLGNIDNLIKNNNVLYLFFYPLNSNSFNKNYSPILAFPLKK